MKILFYDLEVSRSIVEGYGNKWDFKPVKLIRPQELMCVSYKWYGDKSVTWVSRHDFKTMEDFVNHIRNLFDEAHVLVAHNARKFDNRMSNRYFIKNGAQPPSPSFTVDTLQVARSKFKFESNSLNDLCEFLDIGKKENITYADLETDFMTDNPKRETLRLMKKYNNKDVELLEKLFEKLRPWISNFPSVSRLADSAECCPRCGMEDSLQRRGFAYTMTSKYRRYQCQKCFGWTRRRIAENQINDVKPTYSNI